MDISTFKLWVSELFCDHIWKIIKQNPLNRAGIDIRLNKKFEFYAVEQQCVLCKKTEIVEKKMFFID